MKQLFTLCIILCIANGIYAQREGLVKLSQPTLSSILVGKTKLAIKDRFGNSYSLDEISYDLPSLSTAPSLIFTTSNICSDSLFVLHFVDEPSGMSPSFGFNDSNNRKLVCQVFKDLRRLVNDTSIKEIDRVHILVTSDTSVGLATLHTRLDPASDITGTAFESIQYGLKNSWMDNMIYQSIRQSADPYKNLISVSYANDIGYYHGILIVRFTGKTNWNIQYEDTTSISASSDDLYTQTLHQALHMIGLNSFVSQNGTSIQGNNIYSRYDNFLYNTTTSAKVVTYNPTTKSLSNTSGLTNFALGCSSIHFSGTNLSMQNVFTNSSWNSSANLSHFSCASSLCNSSYARPNNYVMVPCLGSGLGYVKRHPNQSEVYSLCDIGYKLNSIGGIIAYGANPANDSVHGQVYTKYTTCSTPCVAMGAHDTFIIHHTNPVTINYSASILQNDIPSNSKILRIALLDTLVGTLSTNSSGFTFTPNGSLQFGEVIIVYYPQCDSTAPLGSPTYITLVYPYPSIPQCDTGKACNYICYGSFEETDQPMFWSNFILYHNKFTENSMDLYKSINGVTCFRNNVEDYWHYCNASKSLCGENSVNIYPPINGGKQFVGIGSLKSYHPNWGEYAEGIYLKLRRPMYHDTTKKYYLKFQARLYDTACPPSHICVMANDSPPPAQPAYLFNFSPNPPKCITQWCTPIGKDTIKNSRWIEHRILLSYPNVGDSITDIIVYNEPYAEDNYAYFDNFEIYDSVQTKVTISSSPDDIMPCSDTSQFIQYEVCLNHGAATNADTVTVQVVLPYGFSLGTGGSFNSSGTYKIPPGQISGSVCKTLNLHYLINYSQVNSNNFYDIKVSYQSNAYCSEEVSNIVRIYPQNTVVSISKSVSNSTPSLGDTIEYRIIVCNSSDSAIQNLLLTDTIPKGLEYISANGMSYSNGVLSTNLFLNGRSGGIPFCDTFTYLAVVKSTCSIVNCAYVKSTVNSCFKAQGCVTINSGSVGAVVDATIEPEKAIWCGNGVPYIIQFGPTAIGSYLYQWMHNGTNIIGAFADTFTANLNGTYSVKINDAGCITLIEAKPLDTGMVVSTQQIQPNCSAANGEIHLSVHNGVKPYTYAWFGSTKTDSFRKNLTTGTYLVTVTDSIGCSRAMSITLTSKHDTLVNASSKKDPICAAVNGSITLSPSGGTAPYTYLWNNGSTSQNRTNLQAGKYKVTITDKNGCTLIDSFQLDTIEVKIVLKVDSNVRPLCDNTGGSVGLSVIGGTPSYHYSWSGSSLTVSSRVGLPSGTYTVTVTDSFGCIDDTSIIVLGGVDKIEGAFTGHVRNCNAMNGRVEVVPSGGKAPYTYLWNTGDTSRVLANIDSGWYQVWIVDSNGCSTDSALSYYVQYGDASTSSVVLLDSIVDCSNIGDIYSVVSYGSPPYTYLWNTFDVTPNLTSVGGGVRYTLTVWDATGCQAIVEIQPGYVPIGIGSSYPNLSSLYASSMMTGEHQRYKVVGDFEADVPASFYHCEFAASAGVKIYLTYTLDPVWTIFDSCHFYSCGTELWKGIECIVQKNLEVKNSLIEDAQYGIEIQNTYLLASNTIFKNNYIGIRSRPTGVYSAIGWTTNPYYVPSSIAFIEECEFSGLGFGTIKTPYTGMITDPSYNLEFVTLAYSNYAWAGVSLSDFDLFVSNKCKYIDVWNGGLLYNVNWSTLSECRFDNIYKLGSSSLNGYPNGIGIYADANIVGPAIDDRPASLNVWGDMSASTDFDQCDIGILARNLATTDISFVKMKNVKTGVYNQNVYRPVVSNCKVESSEYGIRMNFDACEIPATHCLSSDAVIQYNEVTNTGTSAAHHAIECNRSLAVYPVSFGQVIIRENKVTLYGTNGYGIFSNLNMYNSSAFPFLFTRLYLANRYYGNKILIFNPNTTLGGMRLFNCEHLKVFKNEVVGMSTSGSVGMHFENVKGHIACNKVDNTNIGIQFTGDNDSTTKFEANKFYNHNIGLQLDGNATLDSQINMANKWNATCINNQAYSGQGTPSIFLVGSSSFMPSPRFPTTIPFFQTNTNSDIDNCASYTFNSTEPGNYDMMRPIDPISTDTIVDEPRIALPSILTRSRDSGMHTRVQRILSRINGMRLDHSNSKQIAQSELMKQERNIEPCTSSVFNIVPNPIRDYTNIVVKKPIYESVNMILTNMLGSILRTIELKEGIQDSYRLNLEEFSTGIYYLQISTNNQAVFNTKLQIIK